jgi:isopenicillin-N epimerase
LKDRLWDEYQVEVPMVGWGGGHYVRVSIQCYNSPNDVDRLVEALERLLPETAI